LKASNTQMNARTDGISSSSSESEWIVGGKSAIAPVHFHLDRRR
jgi:hypothetical protein